MYSGYLSDNEMEAICSEEQLIRHMLAFEVALAKAQAQQEMIPETAASAIREVVGKFEISPKELSESTARNGVPAIGLLNVLKTFLPADASNYLHFGATSQDVLDTAYILMYREALGAIETRLTKVLSRLVGLAEQHLTTPCIARTRWQQATPIPFGLRLVNWGLPLVRHLERLQELRPRLLSVQLGGASGSLSAMGPHGTKVMNAVAQELELLPASPWHAQRDNVAELGHWLSLVTGSLAKIGQDILLMAQTEVGEVVESGGGGSSAMPHKNNPVSSEVVVALAGINQGLSSTLSQSMLQAGERDGTAWMLEWQTVPQMLINTAAGLRHTETILSHLQVNKDRMLRNIELTNGLVYAEQAVVLLSAQLPRSEATKIVEQACAKVTPEKSLATLLLEQTSAQNINWNMELRPEVCFGTAQQMIRDGLEKIKRIL